MWCTLISFQRKALKIHEWFLRSKYVPSNSFKNMKMCSKGTKGVPFDENILGTSTVL